MELQGNGCVLATFFSKTIKKVIKEFEDLCDNNRDDSDVTGIRYINGGRCELFLGAKGKATTAIEWAMVKAPKENELPKAVQCQTPTVAATNQLCKQYGKK